MKITNIVPMNKENYAVYGNHLPEHAKGCSIYDAAENRFVDKDGNPVLLESALITPIIIVDKLLPIGETVSIFMRKWVVADNYLLIGDFMMNFDEMRAKGARASDVFDGLYKWYGLMKEMYKTIPDVPVWRIPVTYEMCGFVYVSANTLEDAMDIARDDPSIELPDDAEYIDGSWSVDDDEDYIRECYNNNQPDSEFDDEEDDPDD